jgi:putative oxidoreductase
MGENMQRKENLDSAKRIQPACGVNSLAKFSPYAYGIMRIIVGLLFACHGGQKILGFPPPAKIMTLDTLGTVGGYIELICGFLIALGLLTRVAAFIASGMMAVAYFMAHASGGFFPLINRGELAVVYCFLFLYIFFRGSGPFAIDNFIFKAPSETLAGTPRTL